MLLDIQQEIAQEVVSRIANEWDKIVLDIEIGSVDGETVRSPRAFYYFSDEKEQFSTGFGVGELFENLREKMAEADKENRKWSICYLEIESDGQYVFKFSYDQPPRLTELQNS